MDQNRRVFKWVLEVYSFAFMRQYRVPVGLEKQKIEIPQKAATKQHRVFSLNKDAEAREHNLDAN